MRKKSKRTLSKSEIVVNLPRSVELTRRTTSNELEIKVWVSGSRKGTLTLAQGSAQWRPDHNKKIVHRLWWAEFVDHLESMPIHRLKK
jgi:hypothetical protein